MIPNGLRRNEREVSACLTLARYGREHARPTVYLARLSALRQVVDRLLARPKKETFVVTQVHRETRCFMSWLVVTERTTQTLQPIVDQAPTAFQYCTDGFSTYDV
jgi:hypothetical protein